jgi:hypothetical protein
MQIAVHLSRSFYTNTNLAVNAVWLIHAMSGFVHVMILLPLNCAHNMVPLKASELRGSLYAGRPQPLMHTIAMSSVSSSNPYRSSKENDLATDIIPKVMYTATILTLGAQTFYLGENLYPSKMSHSTTTHSLHSDWDTTIPSWDDNTTMPSWDILDPYTASERINLATESVPQVICKSTLPEQFLAILLIGGPVRETLTRGLLTRTGHTKATNHVGHIGHEPCPLPSPPAC